MQMFHLQTMNLISHYHGSLMVRDRDREVCMCVWVVGLGVADGDRVGKIIIINGYMQTQ